MAKSKHNRKPNFKGSAPLERQPRVKESQPVSSDHETPAWQFHRCDKEHPLWGWNKLSCKERVEIIETLHSFEQINWFKLKEASGGKARGNGTNHHSFEPDELSSEAKKRLSDLKLDDRDVYFSLRLTNTLRLYAIKDGRVLKFIWHDPYHGTTNGAYPTTKK